MTSVLSSFSLQSLFQNNAQNDFQNIFANLITKRPVFSTANNTVIKTARPSISISTSSTVKRISTENNEKKKSRESVAPKRATLAANVRSKEIRKRMSLPKPSAIVFQHSFQEIDFPVVEEPVIEEKIAPSKPSPASKDKRKSIARDTSEPVVDEDLVDQSFHHIEEDEVEPVQNEAPKLPIVAVEPDAVQLVDESFHLSESPIEPSPVPNRRSRRHVVDESFHIPESTTEISPVPNRKSRRHTVSFHIPESTKEQPHVPNHEVKMQDMEMNDALSNDNDTAMDFPPIDDESVMNDFEDALDNHQPVQEPVEDDEVMETVSPAKKKRSSVPRKATTSQNASKSRRRQTMRIVEAAKEAGEKATATGKRQRIQPLQWWRLERVEHSMESEGLNSIIPKTTNIITVDKTPVKSRSRRGRR